jgi:hypothetical protein
MKDVSVSDSVKTWQQIISNGEFALTDGILSKELEV